MANKRQELEGFLLGRQSKDINGKIEISYWVKTQQGTVKVIPERQQSIFFVSAQAEKLIQDIPQTKILTQTYTSFQNELLLLLSCESVAVQQYVVKLLESEKLAFYEHDVRPEDRFLMERGIRGGVCFQAVSDNDGKVFSNAKLKASNVNPSWNVWSLDIETSVSRNQLLSIGVVSDALETCFIVSDQVFDDERVVVFADEKSLLLAFMRFVRLHSPDIIIGWNVIAFDLNFLDQRCQALGLKPNFGVAGNNWHVRGKDSEAKRFIDIPGRAVLDGISLLKVAGYHFDSYSLENVSRTILEDGKLLHGSQRWQEIERIHQEEPQQFVEYNLQDCQLVLRIFKQLKLIELQQTRVELTGIPLAQMGGSVAAFENQYLPLLHQHQKAAPNYSQDEFISSPGGFVMSSEPGLYKNVLVFDFKSLYPSIIRTFLIDPLARVSGGDRRVAGFLGASFDKDKVVLPTLIGELTMAREAAKKDKNSTLSYAIKIIMNSFYGVLGSNLCRFYHPELASSITMRGQQVLSMTRVWFEEAGAKVIYGDTDSLFVVLPDVDSNEDKIKAEGGRFCVSINQQWQDWCRQEFDVECHLELEFEQIYNRFFMPTIRGQQEGSKKRYAGLVGNQLIFKGLEAVRSDWTPFAREFQRQLFERIFHDLSPIDYIHEILEQLYAGEFDQELIYQKRLSRPLGDYIKITPPHVRAARIADQKRLELGIKPEYEKGRCSIAYYYSRSGIQPFEAEDNIQNLDYDHYVEKQIEPIADSILSLFGTSMAELTSRQIGLL